MKSLFLELWLEIFSTMFLIKAELISDTSMSQIPSLLTSLIFINLVEYLYGRDSFIFVTYSDTSILAPIPIFESYWSR